METTLVFVDNLRKKMKEYDYSQERLAKALDIAPSTISMWLACKNMPRFDMLDKMAQLFNCTTADLISPDTGDKKMDAIIKNGSGVSFVIEYVRDMDKDTLNTLAEFLKLMAKEK